MAARSALADWTAQGGSARARNNRDSIGDRRAGSNRGGAVFASGAVIPASAVAQSRSVSDVFEALAAVNRTADAGALGVIVRTAWQADVPSGVIGTPTLSADGATVYAFSRDGKIVALNAEDGSTRWTYDIGGHGFATMTVSPDGLIIPTGSLGAPLTLLRDRGDRAEQVWQRTDLATVSLSTLTQQQTAWTVARDPGKDSLSLVEVSTTDGATKRTLPLPNSRGFATGVSVSYAGQIATATNLGEVYFFDSKADLE